MVRAASLLPCAAILFAAPALAQEPAAAIDIPAARMNDAIRLLGRQSRASIGFHDARLAKFRLRAVRGTFTTAQALERMLAGSGARARWVAPLTWVIEFAPAPPRRVAQRRAQVTRPRRAAAPDVLPGDIVVTASKRDVPLSVYPGGVQIIDGASLSFADGAAGTDAIERRAASLTSTHLGPGRNKLFIRGIADSSFVGPTQATVGQYWGNSRVTYSAPDPSLRLYDVQSIEVLEGPQGTLYGAGSLGGVVRVVPHAPDLASTSGRAWGGVQAVQHGQPGGDGGAILNVPLVDDRLALRGLVFGAIDGGYIDDRERGLNDVNRVRTFGGRAALRYAPGDDWTIDLSGLGQRILGDDSQYADRADGGLSRSSAIAQPYRNDYWLTDLVVRKRWGPLELTSSLGYTGQRVFEQFEGAALFDVSKLEVAPDADAGAAAFTQDNRIRMLTGEVRLARRGADGTGWLVAASFLHNVALVNRRMDEFPMSSLLTGVRNQVDEATLYGEGTIAPIDRVTLTLGGRLTRSRLAGEPRDVSPLVALRFDARADDDRVETRALPSAALAFRLNDRATLFARYQQGFRPGGIAVRQDFIQRFDGDRIYTSEAGVRFTTGRLDTSLTVSWTRWRNIQADLVDGFGFPTTANIGDGRIWSAGWAARWQPVIGLTLDGAVYLNDSRLVQPAFAVLPAATGMIDQSRLPNVADASARVGAAYSTPVSNDATLDVTAFARYIGQSTLGIGTILGRLQGDYVDTGLEVRVGTARRGLSLSATNLLDARGNRFALGSPFLIRDQNQITPLQPRSVRLGFDVAF